LQSRPVGAVFADAGTLGMADPHMLEDRSPAVEDQEAFVASPGIDTRLSLRVGAEAPDRQAVGVVTQLVVPAPELAAGMIPDRVPDREPLATVAVKIEGIGIMAGLAVSLPAAFEPVVVDPEVRVAVLDEDLLAPAVSREIEKGQRVAVGQRVGLQAIVG